MFKHKLIILMCIAFVALGVVTAGAYVRPNNPAMDNVPQNFGIYDTYYKYFYETDCRDCHGASTAVRHHYTEHALGGDCLFCHDTLPNPTVPPVRDCKRCHKSNTRVVKVCQHKACSTTTSTACNTNGDCPVGETCEIFRSNTGCEDSGDCTVSPDLTCGNGDYNLPHHRTDAADAALCTNCHDPNLLVEYGTGWIGSEPITNITPTPAACENCHWPSGNAAHVPPSVTEWNSWTGSPKPTTWPDSLAHPQSIEANGQCTTGVLDVSKSYRPSNGLHHIPGGDSKVYAGKCAICHASNPDGTYNSDADKPENIRFCENCHDISTLHGIDEHVTDNSIYNVNNVLNQTVTASEKCVACHGDALPGLPPLPASVPFINYMTPNTGGNGRTSFGSAGIIIELHSTALKPFGLQMDGDKVLMCQGACVLPTDWHQAQLVSWAEEVIEIRVPGWLFTAGSVKVRVHKENVGDTAIRTFVYRKHPTNASLTPATGNWATLITINGDGYADPGTPDKEKVYPAGPLGDRYGYSTRVEIVISNDRYRLLNITDMDGAAGVQLSPTQIKATLTSGQVLDVNTGNPVPTNELYEGDYNLFVITDYFKDDGSGTYDGGLSGLDPNDEVIYSEISDPIRFTVTNAVQINSITPRQVPYWNTATIWGINFGDTKGTSKALVGSKFMEDNSALGGDNDGICETGEVCMTNPLYTKEATTYTWSNSSISFKVPKFGGANYPKKRWVQVLLSDGKRSNLQKLIILAAP